MLITIHLTHELKPTLPPKPWFADFSHYSRKTISSICRLHFNHNCRPAPLEKFIPTASPYFPYFPFHPEIYTIANMNHNFFQCPNFHPRYKNLSSPSYVPTFLTHGLWHHSWPIPSSQPLMPQLLSFPISPKPSKSNPGLTR